MKTIFFILQHRNKSIIEMKQNFLINIWNTLKKNSGTRFGEKKCMHDYSHLLRSFI